MSMPQVSDGEWDVMKVVWDQPGISAQEVCDALAVSRNWSVQTVKTLLNRLVKKGALRFEQQGRKFIYHSAVDRAALVRVESKSFLSRVFDGAVGSALMHFIEMGNLSASEIQTLRQSIEKEEKSGAKKASQKKSRGDGK